MTEDKRFHVPLLLCCAEENEIALVKVVDQLHKEGLAPEVVTGVDLDGGILAGAVDRTDGPALFVLCQSDELKREQTRRLSGLFSARKGRDHRLITVQLTPSRPLSVLPAIRAGMKELLREQYNPPEEEQADARGHMRDVVGPTRVAAVARADDELPRDAEDLARELHDEMIAAEALLNRRDRRPSPSSGQGPGRASSGHGPSSSHAHHRPGSTGRGLSSSESRPSFNARRDSPATMRRHARGEPGAPAREVIGESGARPLGVGAFDDDPISPRGDITPDEVELTTDPMLPESRRAPPAADPQRSRTLLLVAALGILGLGVVAFMAIDGNESDAAASERAAVGDGVGSKSPASQGTPANGAQPRVGQAAPANPVPPQKAIPRPPEGADSAGTDPVPPERPDGNAGQPSGSVPPPPKGIDSEDAHIDAAIAAGKLRAIDTLLVAAGSRETMTWGSAAGICRVRRVDNVRGFRLPSRGELRRLRKARMLGSGTYWSRSRLDTGDEAHAYDTKSGRMNVYLTVEPVGRPVCVRKR